MPVTVSVNGTWVGQWDENTGWIPLDSVVQGKNELMVELPSAAKGQVTIDVLAKRTGGEVSLLRMNFQAKAAGKYAYTFVAR